jgi:hypothetical protein
MLTTRLMTGVLVSIAVLVAPSVSSAQQPAGLPVAADDPGEADEGFVDRLEDQAEEIAEKTQIIERLNGDVDGWYPRLGGMTRGSGFAIGPGYRLHTFDDRIFVDLSAGISLKGYKAVDANVRWLQALDDRLELWTDFRYEDFPQEDFFGMGLSSSREARTSYDFDSTDIAVRGVVRPVPWLRAGTTVGYLRPEIGPGSDGNYPSIEELFTDVDAPGLAAQPNFMHTTFFGEIDYLDQRGNPRSGGFYRGALGFWDDRTLEQFDHKRFDALAMHYVPLVASRRHVLSGRLGLTYVNNETGERVPFYFLGYVGGVDTVRGYREFRFKDENAIWLGAEYMWTVHEYVSVVTFLDAGEVRPDWADVDLSGLKTGYGFGFRVHSDKQTFARIDFGTGGGEGWQIFLKLGPRF